MAMKYPHNFQKSVRTARQLCTYLLRLRQSNSLWGYGKKIQKGKACENATKLSKTVSTWKNISIFAPNRLSSQKLDTYACTYVLLDIYDEMKEECLKNVDLKRSKRPSRITISEKTCTSQTRSWNDEFLAVSSQAINKLRIKVTCIFRRH